MHKISTAAAIFIAVGLAAADTPKVLFKQDFESIEAFEKLSAAGYTAAAAETGDRWGIFRKPAVFIDDSNAAVGKRSARLVRQERDNLPLVGIPGRPLANGTLELWFHRDAGASFTLTAYGDRDPKTGNPAPVVAMVCDRTGAFRLFSCEDNRYHSAGGKAPDGEWCALKLRFADRKCVFSAEIGGDVTAIGETPANGRIVTIKMVASVSDPGRGTNIDEIVFTAE